MRQPVVYNDLDALDPERRALLQEKGVRAIAALPLMTETEQVDGALLLQRERDVPFGDEIAFLGLPIWGGISALLVAALPTKLTS